MDYSKFSNEKLLTIIEYSQRAIYDHRTASHSPRNDKKLERQRMYEWEYTLHYCKLILWQRQVAETRTARLQAAAYQDHLDTVSDTRYAGCL